MSKIIDKNQIRRAVNKSLTYMRCLGFDASAFFGSCNYERFVVLGRSRVGSTFLRGLLNSHRKVVTYGELFRDYQFIGWGFPDYPQFKSLLALIQNDPIRFLEKKVFRKYPKNISAVGFKLFYYHAHNDGRGIVWEYLKTDRDLRIIHIKRRNILKTHLSRKRAVMSGNWANTSGVTNNHVPISLSYEDCKADFIRTRKWETQHDTFFENHPKLDVFYEDLAKDYVSGMKRIQEFLGVKLEVLKPITYKQSSQSLSNSILNYVELKDKFKDTEWEEFFED